MLNSQIKNHLPQITTTLHQLSVNQKLDIKLNDIINMKLEDFMQNFSHHFENEEKAKKSFQDIKLNIDQLDSSLIYNFNRLNNAKNSYLINHFQKKFSKPIIAIEEDDFMKYYPSKQIFDIDIFQQSFSRLFLDYAKKKFDNEVNEFLYKQKKT